MREYKVLCWDINADTLEHYDILPYLRERLKERKRLSKRKSVQKAISERPEMFKILGMPITREQLKEFIEAESRYQWWGRCEYEMICHGWPVKRKDYKLDVHEQVMMNIDIITDILWEEIEKSGEKTRGNGTDNLGKVDFLDGKTLGKVIKAN